MIMLNYTVKSGYDVNVLSEVGKLYVDIGFSIMCFDLSNDVFCLYCPLDLVCDLFEITFLIMLEHNWGIAIK